MSMAALLEATYQTLRSSVPGIRPSNCQITYDAQPPAADASPLFLCLYPTGWRTGPSRDIHEAIEEQYGIALAINMRTSVIPRDRWGEEAYLNQSRSIEQAARDLIIAMYAQRYSLIKLANQYLGFTDGSQIIEPFEFDDAPLVPELMPAEWFHAQPEGDMINIPTGHRIDRSGRRKATELTTGAADPLEYHGLLLQLHYQGARRIIPSGVVDYRITVDFQVTENTSPAITGTYRGTPDAINVTIDGNTLTPTYDNGIWSIPSGQVMLSIGLHDVQAEALYLGGEVTARDETVDEIRVIDPKLQWAWTSSASHIWADGRMATWVT